MSDRSNQLDRAQRAAARRAQGQTLPIRSFPLGQEPVLDLRRSDSITERLAELAQLSRRVYQLSGHPLPSYTRQTMPGRVIRSAAHDE